MNKKLKQFLEGLADLMEKHDAVISFEGTGKIMIEVDQSKFGRDFVLFDDLIDTEDARKALK